MKIRLEEMSWPEVEAVLREPNAVLLPTGSIEQHGEHLPLNVDSRCAEYIAEEAARRIASEHNIRTIVAPTVKYVEISTFSKYPGTTGISLDTFMRVIGDILHSLASQGFKNIIIVNGHSPIRAPLAAALQRTGIELQNAGIPNIGLYAVNWWDLGFDVVPNIRKSESGLHADELETAVSLVIQPENVHLDKAVKWFPSWSLSSRWVGSPDLIQRSPPRVLAHSRKRYPGGPREAPGVMGDPTVASRETGEKIISAVVDDLVKIIVEVVKSERSDT